MHLSTKMPRKILIMGLPRAGKTTLAHALVPLLRAVHFDAHDRRDAFDEGTEFDPGKDIECARHMRWMCDQVTKAGHHAIADFICPTPDARTAFGDAYVIYLNTRLPPYVGKAVRFVPPDRVDYEVDEQNAEHHATIIAHRLLTMQNGFDWHKPTALFVGSFRPFRDYHRAQILEGLERVGQVCIAVRGAEDIDAENPFGFMTIRNRIEIVLANYLDKIAIIGIPNIIDTSHDSDTGHAIESIGLSAALQISYGATC